MSQHRSLQPSGPPQQGGSSQHSHNRLNDSFDAIRQEFDILASDMTAIRRERDEYESKSELDFFPLLLNSLLIDSPLSSFLDQLDRK